MLNFAPVPALDPAHNSDTAPGHETDLCESGRTVGGQMAAAGGIGADGPIQFVITVGEYPSPSKPTRLTAARAGSTGRAMYEV
ncbi:hypothetical protein EVAR_68374_1 [Eumeta japonica]|uniref:Uncharacterized protein n=1 Tax=Eumeta variegata TaxID=151549 RepID=A0A4C1ZS98_EUMVA|nr:hypothetical protein EVAR_68374_1 [Eumeta japonica]